MQEIYSEFIRKILQNKSKLEKGLKVKITNKGKILFVEGNAEDEYTAVQAIEAINLGFTVQQALLLTEEGFILEKVNIKDLTRRHDLERIRGRVIGTKGKTKKLIENLSDCLISLHDNIVGIIGRAEHIEQAMQALTSLIQGAKQSKVYSFLERARSKEKARLNEDLGLKSK
jgi:ribosomal RNA assembly protein